MRIHSFPILLAVIGNLLCASAFAVETEVFVSAESYSYSEIAPIKQFSSSLEGPMIDKGTIAFSTNVVSSGQRFKVGSGSERLHIALFSRVDYALKFSHDTALLLYANENDIVLDNKIRDVYLKANHISAQGLSIAYSGVTFYNIGYHINFAYMHAQKMIYGGINGELTSLENDAKGHLNLDYFYSEDVFFDREKGDYSANGYAMDLQLTWQPTDRLRIDFIGRDIVSNIVWKKQQQTIAQASTNRVTTDGLGNTNVRAVLSWQELDSKVNQHLPQQFRLTETYSITATDSVSLEQFSYDGSVFHRLGYHRSLLRFNSDVTAFYDVTTQAYGAAFNMRYVSVGVCTDNFDFDKAKVLGIDLGVHLPLNF